MYASGVRGEVPAGNINVGILFKVTGLRSPAEEQHEA